MFPAPSGPGVVKIDERQRALVDIRAAVTPSLLTQVKALDGIVVSPYPAYDSTIAWIPLVKLEQLAADSAVRFVEPAVSPMLNATQPAVKP